MDIQSTSAPFVNEACITSLLMDTGHRKHIDAENQKSFFRTFVVCCALLTSQDVEAVEYYHLDFVRRSLV